MTVEIITGYVAPAYAPSGGERPTNAALTAHIASQLRSLTARMPERVQAPNDCETEITLGAAGTLKAVVYGPPDPRGEDDRAEIAEIRVTLKKNPESEKIYAEIMALPLPECPLYIMTWTAQHGQHVNLKVTMSEYALHLAWALLDATS